MAEYKITLCREFVEQCKNQGIEDIKKFVFKLTRAFVPVQKLSDAMKGNNHQCSFNFVDDVLEVVDPFNLFDCDAKKFDLNEIPI